MIVCAGEALVDLVPQPVPGGGPMNAAIAAARLGADAAFLGRVSNDEHGQTIWRHLTSNGVDTRLVERGDEPTARAIVEHVPELRFTFEGIGTADTCLQSADIGILGDERHVIHGGTLGMFRGRTAELLADMIEVHPGIVSLDPNVRPQIIDDREAWDHFHRRWLERANIVKLSIEDLNWIWPDRSSSSVMEELLASDVTVVMITDGGDGVRLGTSSGSIAVPARKIEVVDTVGAGDTFVGSILADLVDDAGAQLSPDALAMLEMDDWVTMVTRASVAASVVCQRTGADPPTSDEVDAAMAEMSD